MQLSAIKVNPKNPRLIKDAKADKLMQSLLSFPQMLSLRPIVVDKKGFALGGNMRFLTIERIVALTDAEFQEACAKYAVSPANVRTWQEVRDSKQIPDAWVLKADKLTPEQQREFVIKDNVSGGEWDWDVLANEWDVQDLEDWGLDIPDFAQESLEAEEDDFNGVAPKEPITVLGDLYEIGEHRLMCGDSTCSDTVAKLMNGEKADMVFTDPPYNIDYQGVNQKMDKIKNDKMSDSDFVQFLYDALNINSDTFYVCCSWQYSHLFREAMDKLQKPVKSFIVWNKVNPAQHLDKYFKQHEIILYHGKFGGQKTLRGDIWEVKREQNTVHPTMKPISLISIALQDNSDKIKIYDAFLGSGSTMVASHQLKRKCYGMELDCRYADVIVKRMLKLDKTLKIKKNGIDETETWLKLIDGKSLERDRARDGSELREWRTKVFKRDNYTCQHCGDKKQIQAHHIVEWAKDESKRFDIDNGITLCVKCHSKVHGRNIGHRSKRPEVLRRYRKADDKT